MWKLVKMIKEAYQNQCQNLFKMWSFGTGFSFSNVNGNTKKFCWDRHCIKSDVFFNDFFTKCEQIRRYLQNLVIHIWLGFLLFHFVHVVNYKKVKYKRFSRDWLWRHNIKTLWFQQNYHDEMDSRCAYVVILYFCLYFFFWMGFSLEPFCHTKTSLYIFTHPAT